MPKASTTEEASAAARDLIEALLHPGPASPLSPLSDSHRQVLFQLADIFSQATAEDPPLHLPYRFPPLHYRQQHFRGCPSKPSFPIQLCLPGLSH
eukprot:scaffold256000_cov20-Attheya_sp.AAC.1